LFIHFLLVKRPTIESIFRGDGGIGFSARHGGHFELTTMRNKISNPDNIKTVNAQMPGPDATKQSDFTTGTYDVPPQQTDNTFNLYECKSISGDAIDEIGKGNWDSFDQFLDAIGSVPKIENYHLIFNSAAFSGNNQRAKKAMQGLFQKKGDVIFDKMYANPRLKTSFFNDKLEAEARIFFYQQVNLPINNNNTLFNFVKQ
jgi:hypothetical protein